ncbi:hypothetical protein [Bowmanella dokdonensis]|uniref:Uncharacterized protein n=1 Tax=Bowmanella dokdonensis TaxID=751969 RepID=A0A939DR60_9ALTE|nr:hypothetical protein [Bowmanella dokdonensis]MBN7827302.1 hypothetical protein [Bowmanella dokdonensis]
MNFLYWFTSAFIAVLVGICSFNWLVDPFAMYWSDTYAGFNRLKPEAELRSRVVKAYRSLEVCPNVLIVGNSRPEMGLDPTHPLFEGKTVYNLALPGADLPMQLDYAENVLQSMHCGGVEMIFLSIDFLDFLLPEDGAISQVPPEYLSRLEGLGEDTLSASVFRLKEKSSLFFSLDATTASIRTTLNQSEEVNSITPLGFNTAGEYIDIIRHEGIAPLFRQKFISLQKGLTSRQFKLLNTEQENPYMNRLSGFIGQATGQGIQVYAFTSPYHYSYLHLLAELGYWQSFNQWKLMLADLATSVSSERVYFWDFSGFSDFTTEAFPVGKSTEPMQWYWEPAHYRKELGDIMLQKMLGEEAGRVEFGRSLDGDSIQSILAEDRAGLQGTAYKWETLQGTLNFAIEEQPGGVNH